MSTGICIKGTHETTYREGNFAGLMNYMEKCNRITGILNRTTFPIGRDFMTGQVIYATKNAFNGRKDVPYQIVYVK